MIAGVTGDSILIMCAQIPPPKYDIKAPVGSLHILHDPLKTQYRKIAIRSYDVVRT